MCIRDRVQRTITVDGDACAKPQNVVVPVGTAYQDILDYVGVKGELGKVVAGGAMMGPAVENLSYPTTKTTSGLILLSKAAAQPAQVNPCIRCGRCVEYCPMGLEPVEVNQAYACLLYTSQILAKGGDAGHVHDDGAGICGQTAVGHFAAQTLFNEDQLCAGAVDTGQGLYLNSAVVLGLFAQQVDALGLVVLNTNDALRDAGILQHSLDAADDIIAALQHLLRVAGQPHLALGGVDQ